jgi:hypothetical protein
VGRSGKIQKVETSKNQIIKITNYQNFSFFLFYGLLAVVPGVARDF